MYRISMRRGGRKRPVAKGCPYGKPKSSGAVKQQKPERNLQSIAEERVGRYGFFLCRPRNGLQGSKTVLRKQNFISAPFFVAPAFALYFTKVNC